MSPDARARADVLVAYMAAHRETLARIVDEAPPPPDGAVAMLRAAGFPTRRKESA